MSLSPRWRLVAGAALLVALAVGGATWWYRARRASTASLLGRLPARESVVVAIDFAALRQSGVLNQLAGSRVAEEAEYRTFVNSTNFDYQRDLDYALVAFAPQARYFLLRGRFDFAALTRYTESQGGVCKDGFCRMQGSTPERRISFFPLQSNVLAMAVSSDSSAASLLDASSSSASALNPNAPLWIAIPNAVLHSGEGLPAGTRMFARAMEKAESITIGIGPDGSRMAARLHLLCSAAQEASAIASELNRTTGMLRQLIEREHQHPNPADLSGVLASGSFRSEGTQVFGYWAIERAFLDNLLGGKN